MLLPADLLSALKVRWRLQVLICVAILILVAIWTLFTPKVYDASSSLLFDAGPVQPVGQETTSQENATALIATQADVIQSEAIASDVSKALQMTSAPALVAQWRDKTGGVGDINSWYGQQLLANLTVVPVKSSRVLSIHYSANDPQFAAQVANGFATSYLDARLRQQTDPARTYSRWFEDRTREVRSALEKAQQRLTAFQRQTGIVDTGVNNADTTRLSELSNQLASAEAAAADLNARAAGAASASPDVQGSPVVQQLRAQIAIKSAELSQMSSDFGPNHPARQAATAELSALRARLDGEIGTSTRAVRVASGSASGKEGTLRNRVASQRQDMLKLASDRAQLDVLQHDVDSARAAYDAVTQRLGTMRLQSEAPASNVTQLDVASPPLLPSSPNVVLRMLLGLVLGGLLAVGTAAALEIWRPKVRTALGASAVSGVPVLGTINFETSRVNPLLRTGMAA